MKVTVITAADPAMPTCVSRLGAAAAAAGDVASGCWDRYRRFNMLFMVAVAVLRKV